MAAETLIAIDPGKNECAVAMYDHGWLQCIFSHPSFTPPPWRERTHRAVYELPQADGRNAPPDDLIIVAAAGAELAAACSLDVHRYQVREWKGSIPKAAHHHQAWTVFTEAEQALLGGEATLAAITAACARGAKVRWQKRGALAGNHFYSDRELPTVGGLKITHDLLDAAVLGLYDLGRLKGIL